VTNSGWHRLSKLLGAALAASLLLGACGGGDDDDAKSSGKKDDKSTETTAKQADALPAGTTYFATVTAPKVDVFDSADAPTPVNTIDKPTGPKDPPMVFLVDGTDVSKARIPVLLPYKPNHGKGFVDKAQVSLTKNPYAIKIELAAHKLTVTQGDKTILETPVGLGQEGMETPEGRFFLVKLYKNPNPADSYGPYAYGTSAYSDITDPEFLAKFPGAQVGIHGTNNPSSIGKNVSHGCIRMSNENITKLSTILPLGTPVDIVA
jgi:lipoprotein-anchoring transpeptidase ErfK/SrfK